MLIAAGLVLLAAISTNGSWNPFLLGSLFLFFCLIYFGLHFHERQAALSSKFWENYPKLRAFFIGLGSLFAFLHAYEAWTGIDLFSDPRKPSLGIYYANVFGKIPITLLFTSLGFLALYIAYLSCKEVALTK